MTPTTLLRIAPLATAGTLVGAVHAVGWVR